MRNASAMGRYSIHVDAGYLFAALATRETGSANRGVIDVDVEAMVTALHALAAEDCGLSMLRVLWYDAARDGLPDAAQRRIGMLDSVKLRMGRVNAFGEQKGVDLRLGLDLVSLAVNRAVEVAYLISGDDDISEAVRDAQDLGLQVKLIVVPSIGDSSLINVAANLRLTADGTRTLPARVIDATVTRAVRRTPIPPPAIAATARNATESLPGTVAPRASDRDPRPIPVPVPFPPDRTLTPRRPALPVPTVTAAVPPAPERPVVYSSESGKPSGATAVSAHDRMIDEVAQSVFQVWATSASDTEVQALRRGRPNIPPQLDRVLLIDLVARSGLDDIPEHDRYALRAAFWDAADRG